MDYVFWAWLGHYPIYVGAGVLPSGTEIVVLFEAAGFRAERTNSSRTGAGLQSDRLHRVALPPPKPH